MTQRNVPAFARMTLTLAALAAALIFCPLPTSAQVPPGVDGLRFNRFAGKDADTLAKKPGGPTERIEIQSTTDNIDYVVKAFTLKEANAAEIYQWISNSVALEGGRVERFAPGSSVNVNGSDVEVVYEGQSLLVVTAPDWMMEGLAQTIATLDKSDFQSGSYGNAGGWYRPKHRKASELADLVAASAASGVQLFVPDDSRNILYLEDVPSFYGCVMDGFATYDVPPYQLDTRVCIFELSDDDVKDIGLDWYAWKKSIDGDNSALVLNWDNSGNSGSYDIDLQSITAQMTFTPALATEFLNYLASKGKAKVISDTRMALVNGTPGTVSAVQQIPYQIKGGTPDGVLFQTAEAGVEVSIDPSIASETIELTVNATVSSHMGYTPTDGMPIISASNVSSNVILEPGKPAVVGGLTRTSEVTERSGIPGLKDIPVVRYAFSREYTRTATSQILITVTPLDMPAGAELADVPAEAVK